ncbi:MAG: hypothetical protein ACYTEV_08615 [Planctomycetota bacterium]|jgi:hypothetical protein
MPVMPPATNNASRHAPIAAAAVLVAATLAAGIAAPAAGQTGPSHAGPPAAADTTTPPPDASAIPRRPAGPAPVPAAAAPGRRPLDPRDPRRVIQGAEDVGPLSTAQWVDLRRDVDGAFNFGTVYREGDLFMRSLGALRAVFPRSEYMSPRLGSSMARIPAGTRFMIGDGVQTPEWTARSGMLQMRSDDGGTVDGRVSSGLAAGLGPSAGPGAVPVDGRSAGRVLGTGLANDPVVMRHRLESRTPHLAGPDPRAATADVAAGDRTLLPPEPLPPIVEDPAYRRDRLRAILLRAVAASRSSSPD